MKWLFAVRKQLHDGDIHCVKTTSRYTWAHPDWVKIPQAYVLPKRKKLDIKGRPTILLLSEDASDLLFLMTQSLGHGDMYDQINSFRTFFSITPTECTADSL